MQESKQAFEYFPNKYGKDVRPYIGYFDFCNDDIKFTKENESKSAQLSYHYVVKDIKNDHEHHERIIAQRAAVLQDPASYTGFPYSDNGIFIVNGLAEITDANFIGEFGFDRLGMTGLYMGSFPASEFDIEKLS